MKKLIGGMAFLFTGLILYAIAHIQAVSYLPSVTQWPTDKGKYWGALSETYGLLPMYAGIAFCTVGVVFIIFGCFEDKIKTMIRSKGEGEPNV